MFSSCEESNKGKSLKTSSFTLKKKKVSDGGEEKLGPKYNLLLFIIILGQGTLQIPPRAPSQELLKPLAQDKCLCFTSQLHLLLLNTPEGQRTVQEHRFQAKLVFFTFTKKKEANHRNSAASPQISN